MQNPCLLPSIFASNFADSASALSLMEGAGIRRIHYDVMDNHFVPNMSFGLQFCQQLIKAAAFASADIHLMITLPGGYEDFLALKPEVLTVHVEAAADVRPILRSIRAAGVKAGISVKPKTPLSALEPLKGEFDLLLIMSVEPGFSFQSFIPESVAKVKEARRLFGPDIIIEADGGIGRANMEALRQAGLDWFVMGGAFFKDENPAQLNQALGALK